MGAVRQGALQSPSGAGLRQGKHPGSKQKGTGAEYSGGRQPREDRAPERLRREDRTGGRQRRHAAVPAGPAIAASCFTGITAAHPSVSPAPLRRAPFTAYAEPADTEKLPGADFLTVRSGGIDRISESGAASIGRALLCTLDQNGENAMTILTNELKAKLPAAHSGGADRGWLIVGCAATLEGGSWRGSNDSCYNRDVTCQHEPKELRCPRCGTGLYLEYRYPAPGTPLNHYRCNNCGYERDGE